jgi:hypothetical protein
MSYRSGYDSGTGEETKNVTERLELKRALREENQKRENAEKEKRDLEKKVIINLHN